MARKPKVLLVDDESAILESTKQLMLEMGYEVVTLQHADRIVPTLLGERPDLLLQDVRMPGLDLDALMRKIRAEPAIAGTPVLLFSAGMDLDDIAARVGGARKVEKPFKPSELVDAIEGALS